MDHILHDSKFLAIRLPHMESLWTSTFYYLQLCMLAAEKKQESTLVSSTCLVLSPSSILKKTEGTLNP